MQGFSIILVDLGSARTVDPELTCINLNIAILLAVCSFGGGPRGNLRRWFLKHTVGLELTLQHVYTDTHSDRS